MTQTGTMTKLQNKKHENMNIKHYLIIIYYLKKYNNLL